MKSKKTISILLSLFMCISCLFTTSFTAAAQTNDTVNFALTNANNVVAQASDTVSVSALTDENAGETASATSLKSYDPRPKNLMTPVKSQGDNNVCWAFAANAALESAVSYKTGLKKSYSEEHMRFILSKKLAEKNNDNVEDGYYTRNPTAGSQCLYPFIYYTNWNTTIFNKPSIEWSAPVYSSDVPYNFSYSNDWPTGMENCYRHEGT